MSEEIINGIDVSECEHHYTNPVNGVIYHGCAIYEQINELGYSQDTLCEQNPNCYYKQLKRLEQELDIKEKMLDKFMIGSGETLEKLQQENEGLKAKNKNYAKLMLEQQEISQKYWECIEKVKQTIGVLTETCKVYPIKTNLDKLMTIINEVLND